MWLTFYFLLQVRVREEAKIEEIHESDEEMEANWTLPDSLHSSPFISVTTYCACSNLNMAHSNYKLLVDFLSLTNILCSIYVQKDEMK